MVPRHVTVSRLWHRDDVPLHLLADAVTQGGALQLLGDRETPVVRLPSTGTGPS